MTVINLKDGMNAVLVLIPSHACTPTTISAFKRLSQYILRLTKLLQANRCRIWVQQLSLKEKLDVDMSIHIKSMT